MERQKRILIVEYNLERARLFEKTVKNQNAGLRCHIRVALSEEDAKRALREPWDTACFQGAWQSVGDLRKHFGIEMRPA